MEGIKLRLLIPLALVLAVSCASGPGNTVEPQEVETLPEIQEVVAEEFDPTNVSQAYYVSTRDDVQQFVEQLNQIIRNRNYNAWRAALTPEYIAVISSPENLHRISETAIMKNNRIVLRTLDDYFTHVVVPSRANVSNRLDVDIAFISESRVRAFSVRTTNSGEEQRVILYDLERIDNSWKIIN